MKSSTNLFVHAKGVLRLVEEAVVALSAVLLTAGLVGDLLACGLLAVWHGITGNEVSHDAGGVRGMVDCEGLPADLVADVGDALLGLVESGLAAVWSHLLADLCEQVSTESWNCRR